MEAGLKRIWEASRAQGKQKQLADEVVEVSQETLPTPRVDTEDDVHREDEEGDDKGSHGNDDGAAL